MKNPELKSKGVYIEKMVNFDLELIAGYQHDPCFGPVFSLGAGGTYVHILDDITFRKLPLSESEIRGALRDLKIAEMIGPFRGQESVNLEKLCVILKNLADFCADLAVYAQSIDFNPIGLIRGPTEDVPLFVLDAKVQLRDEPDSNAINPDFVPKPRTDHLKTFFEPQGVAVVGASATPGKIGNIIIDNLVNHEYTGKVYPINPSRQEILGVTCYPSIGAIPGEEPVDLAIIVIDIKTIPDLLDELAAKNIHNAVIISGGGKELASDAAGNQQDRVDVEELIARKARELDIRLVGPNCIGVFGGKSRFNSFFYGERISVPPDGNLSMITQSGTWGCEFLEVSNIPGVSKMVSYGNKVDVDEADLLAYFKDDPDTRVVATYIEGLGNGSAFYYAADDLIHGNNPKPCVIYKGGRTTTGATAAVSHTGFYGGSYKVYKGIFDQIGLITVDNMAQLPAAAKALTMQGSASGNRIGFVSNGAGPFVNAIDQLPSRGLELARLTRETAEYLKSIFPVFYIAENPVDLTGSASSDDYMTSIQKLNDDPNVDIIMPFFVFQNIPLDEDIIDKLSEINKQSHKPIIACAGNGPYAKKIARSIEEKGIPFYHTVDDWVTAAYACKRWGEISGERENDN